MANGIPVTVGVNTKSHNRMVNIRPGSDTNRWFAAPHRRGTMVIKTTARLRTMISIQITPFAQISKERGPQDHAEFFPSCGIANNSQPPSQRTQDKKDMTKNNEHRPLSHVKKTTRAPFLVIYPHFSLPASQTSDLALSPSRDSVERNFLGAESRMHHGWKCNMFGTTLTKDPCFSALACSIPPR